MKNVAIILASGDGRRFKDDVPKQFIKLAGKSVIEHTLEKFESHPLINEVYVVVHPAFYENINEIVKIGKFKKVTKILNGGKTRQESSRIGILACGNDVDNVLTHDAVRPFVSEQIISDIITQLKNYVSVDVAIPTADTIIKVNDDLIIEEIPNRKYLMRGQTPQGFKLSVIKKAHELAQQDNISNAFDDCSLILKYNLGKTKVVKGAEFNMKITYPLDLSIAEKLFQLNVLEIDSQKKELKKLKGQVIVVFGGSSGIGKEILKVASLNGAKTYNFSKSNGVDVRNETAVSDSLKKVYKENGKIDSVFCTAGILKIKKLEDSSLDEIKDVIDTNLLGSIIVTKNSINYLKETAGSIMLFTSSSYTRGREDYASYSSSKAAIVNFTQAVSSEIHKYGIKLNVLCPERTLTPMRKENFGEEPEKTLLSAKQVAEVALLVTLKNFTGQVVDVRK